MCCLLVKNHVLVATAAKEYTIDLANFVSTKARNTDSTIKRIEIGNHTTDNYSKHIV